MKVMIRRGEKGLCAYVPKKDLEEPIVETERETLWGGSVKLKNGWMLSLPDMPPETRLPITVDASDSERTSDRRPAARLPERRAARRDAGASPPSASSLAGDALVPYLGPGLLERGPTPPCRDAGGLAVALHACPGRRASGRTCGGGAVHREPRHRKTLMRSWRTSSTRPLRRARCIAGSPGCRSR